MSDLDSILRASGARQEPPRVIEVARTVADYGEATRAWFLSNGRLYATVGAGRVSIARRLGIVTEGLRVRADELLDVHHVSRDWARRRDAWAEFGYTESGCPPGWGCGKWYYRAPGKHGATATVGVRRLGKLCSGRELRGREVIVPLAAPRRVGGRVEVRCDLWWRGEEFGPATGSRVGLRYCLGRLRADARRDALRVWRTDDAEVWIEPGEEAFVAALARSIRRASDR